VNERPAVPPSSTRDVRSSDTTRHWRCAPLSPDRLRAEVEQPTCDRILEGVTGRGFGDPAIPCWSSVARCAPRVYAGDRWTGGSTVGLTRCAPGGLALSRATRFAWWSSPHPPKALIQNVCRLSARARLGAVGQARTSRSPRGQGHHARHQMARRDCSAGRALQGTGGIQQGEPFPAGRHAQLWAAIARCTRSCAHLQ